MNPLLIAIYLLVGLVHGSLMLAALCEHSFLRPDSKVEAFFIFFWSTLLWPFFVLARLFGLLYK